MQEAVLELALSDMVEMKDFVVDKTRMLAVAVHSPVVRNEDLYHNRIEESCRLMSAAVLVVHRKENNLVPGGVHSLLEAALELLE